jgi:hypothetical protein
VTTDVDRLREQLEHAQGTIVEQGGDGPFGGLTYRTGDVMVQLVGEYGAWRVNVGVAGQPLLPASFWISALAGEDAVPDPAVTEEDLARVADQLPELLQRAPELAARVATMGEQYSQAMRERLG